MTRRELNQYEMQERLAGFFSQNLGKIKEKPSLISGVHQLSIYNLDIYALTHTHYGVEKSMEHDAKMRKILKSCRLLINDYLDVLMLPYQVSDPEFYNEYQETRTITDQTTGYSFEAIAI